MTKLKTIISKHGVTIAVTATAAIAFVALTASGGKLAAKVRSMVHGTAA